MHACTHTQPPLAARGGTWAHSAPFYALKAEIPLAVIPCPSLHTAKDKKPQCPLTSALRFNLPLML